MLVYIILFSLKGLSMYRKQLILLNNWLSKESRKPLIVRGARQVGKSTLIRLFAEQQQCQLAELNLERYPELGAAFAQNDPVTLTNTLEALLATDILPAGPEVMLFLDEIQSVPEAIPALRYFYEELPQLPLIAAGSLLEFVLSRHRFSMPVGRVEYLHMGPMTFTEFLDAMEEPKLAELIRTFELGDEINPVIHDRLLALLRTYFFVGGMPEAVETYAGSRRFKEVTDVHNSIIDTYREDFPKYIGSRNLNRINTVFNFAARNVGKKVKYSHYSTDDKSATIKADIELLCMARVLSKVTHSHSNGLPLQAEIEEKVYKLIFMDIGMMNAICGLGWDSISQDNERRLVNEGAIAEQFIGQHLQDFLLTSPNRDLTYWLREGRATNAEVDYVVAIHGQIVPVEIKSGATGSLKSLHQFVAEKGTRVAVRFDTRLPALQTVETKVHSPGQFSDISYRLLSLPLYLVERLPEIPLIYDG